MSDSSVSPHRAWRWILIGKATWVHGDRELFIFISCRAQSRLPPSSSWGFLVLPGGMQASYQAHTLVLPALASTTLTCRQGVVLSPIHKQRLLPAPPLPAQQTHWRTLLCLLQGGSKSPSNGHQCDKVTGDTITKPKFSLSFLSVISSKTIAHP